MSDDENTPTDLNSDLEWRELDTYTLKKFIEDVKDENFIGLFNGPAYELYARNLRFFDGFEHYMLNNRSVFPYFSLHYLSNGETHYFLDGSEHCLELLIRKGAFRLTERNILEYLQFHSDATFYPYRKVKFITDPSKTPYSGASAMGHHFKTQKYAAQFELSESAEDECFYVTLPVLYNGETVKGRVQVLKTGKINILDPIQVPLMDGTRDHNPLDYDHPHEQELLQQNIDIIKNSKEGRRLIESIQNHGGQLRFVSGVGSNGIAINSQMGFIVAPENLDTYSPYQVIAIIGILRDMELKLVGQHRPDPFEDWQEVLDANFAINFDIFETICIIVDELNEAGFEEILQKFKKSGHEETFGLYKRQASHYERAVALAKFFELEMEDL